MRFTLTNDFHNTTANVVLTPYQPEERYTNWFIVTKSQARRIARKLCGRTGCVCGDQFGHRGGDISLNIIGYLHDSYLVSVDDRG